MWEFRTETKCHLDMARMKRHKEYYKGEGGGYSQVRAMVSLMSPSCLWLVLTPKVLQLCTNHLVLVLCRSMWVIEACQFFLIPSWNSNMPFYPSTVLRAREHALTPYSFVVFYLGLTFESLKELGAHHWYLILKTLYMYIYKDGNPSTKNTRHVEANVNTKKKPRASK